MSYTRPVTDFFVDDFKFCDNIQKPMVCVSFDDSIATQFTNGQAKLDQYNIKATFYAISRIKSPLDPFSICG